MATDIEGLERLARDKLTGGSELTVSRGGRFLFSARIVEAYHSAGAESWFKGVYLRSDSVLQVTASLPEEIRFPLWPFQGKVLKTLPGSVRIAVFVMPVNQPEQRAHWLTLEEGKGPELSSVIQRRGLLDKFSRRVPTQKDYDFFAACIANSDSRNLWEPTVYFMARPQPRR